MGPSPFGWLHMWFGWVYLLSPCAALLPLLPGGLARHCVPRPSAAWHSLPDTLQLLSLHAGASELRAAACRDPRGPGPQRPSPHAEGIPWPLGHAYTSTGWVGWEKVWLVVSESDRRRCLQSVSLGLVGLAESRGVSGRPELVKRCFAPLWRA